jgi:predicted transcriptional regulator
VIPCNEKDLISLRKEHEDADRIIEELKEANKAIMQQIDQAKFDLTLVQSEDKSNKLSSQISIQTVQVPQPPKFIHQRTFSLASEV